MLYKKTKEEEGKKVDNLIGILQWESARSIFIWDTNKEINSFRCKTLI